LTIKTLGFTMIIRHDSLALRSALEFSGRRLSISMALCNGILWAGGNGPEQGWRELADIPIYPTVARIKEIRSSNMVFPAEF
jgi:hypothetical protein